jgi:hypothetical protein
MACVDVLGGREIKMFTKFPNAILTATLVLLMGSGAALGQRGDRGRGGGEGGDRGGSSARSSGGERSSRSSSDGQRSARSGDSGQRSSRSFSGSPSRSSSERGRQSFEGSRDRGPQSSQFRSFRDSQQGERSTFGRSSDSVRTGQFGDRSGERRGDVSRDRSSFNFDRSGDRSRQTYEARRPNEDQVRDFLQMRDGRDSDRGRDGRDQFRRDSSDRGDLSDQLRGRNRGDRDRSDFVDRYVRDRDDDDYRGRGRDRDDDFRDRDRDGRGGRDYDNWRRGVWLGERGEGRDYRDWSGRWRDGNRFDLSRGIRNNWYQNWGFNSYPFYGNWWNDRGRNSRHWGFWGNYANRYNRPYYWWTWTAAPRLSNWVTYGWPQYYYWDYGPGEYIYYDDGFVYVNGQRYQEAPVFYDRTVQLVERAPDLSDEEAANMEWLPLGVFAVTREGEAEANLLVQLAVTKDGVIGGTAIEQDGGQTFPVEGIVEKETQRAVWSYTNDRGERVLMETSIFNLTQPEATGLVQHGPGEIQVVQFVRLEQPDEGSTASVDPQNELPRPVPR